MKEGVFIGELAKATGLNPKTIRYYEDLGLLGEPRRSESGYRLYSERDAERLRFILDAKLLGLSLHEIKDVVTIWDAGSSPCGHVSHLLDEKLDDLDRRIREMTAFRDKLRAYKAQIDRQPATADVPCAHIAGVAQGKWEVSTPS